MYVKKKNNKRKNKIEEKNGEREALSSNDQKWCMQLQNDE